MTARALVQIVEDDDAVALSLSALLDSYGYDSEVHGTAEAFLAAAKSDAVCVLMDVGLPGLSGLEALAEHTKKIAPAPVIIMTAQSDVPMAVEALKHGAIDFLEKPFSDDDLIARIEAAQRASSASDEQAELAAKFALLTNRETDVMYGVVAGDANKMIAYRLGLSPKTVEIHRARVMEKTGAKSLSQLVRMAIGAGIDTEQGAPDGG